METKITHLLAPITDENDNEWLTPFIPGYDLLETSLSESELASLAVAILKLLGPDQHLTTNWKKTALKQGLRN